MNEWLPADRSRIDMASKLKCLICGHINELEAKSCDGCKIPLAPVADPTVTSSSPRTRQTDTY